MLTCDGEINERESIFFSTLLNKLGTSVDEFIDRMKKLDALTKYFTE